MARVPISEYDAKRLLFPSQLVFSATSRTTASELKVFFGSVPLVVKVDEGVKKRGKQGLVQVGVDAKGVIGAIRKWSDSWSRFLVEPVIEHTSTEEKFLALSRGRAGWLALVADEGGIEIESHWDRVRSVDPDKYAALTQTLDKYHIATLEINPLLVRGREIIALDAAAEIDDAALNLGDVISAGISPVPDRTKGNAERQVAVLDAATPASLKLKIVNPDGAIWMLLSGGGASLVLADEVADLGFGGELGNYGEYSGAPSEDDTYAYTKIIIDAMLGSKVAKKKALILAGGVANFTDVAVTFRGVIRALDGKKAALKKSGVKVFVRRGGPNEEKGLNNMREFLTSAGLLGSIHGHETPLVRVVTEAGDYLR